MAASVVAARSRVLARAVSSSLLRRGLLPTLRRASSINSLPPCSTTAPSRRRGCGRRLRRNRRAGAGPPKETPCLYEAVPPLFSCLCPNNLGHFRFFLTFNVNYG